MRYSIDNRMVIKVLPIKVIMYLLNWDMVEKKPREVSET